jgi:hypothetical protein
VSIDGPEVAGGALTYVVAAPAWKTAYRAITGEDGEVDLQAWAVIENATGEDWEDVTLTLSSGSPVTLDGGPARARLALPTERRPGSRTSRARRRGGTAGGAHGLRGRRHRGGLRRCGRSLCSPAARRGPGGRQRRRRGARLALRVRCARGPRRGRDAVAPLPVRRPRRHAPVALAGPAIHPHRQPTDDARGHERPGGAAAGRDHDGVGRDGRLRRRRRLPAGRTGRDRGRALRARPPAARRGDDLRNDADRCPSAPPRA